MTTETRLASNRPEWLAGLTGQIRKALLGTTSNLLDRDPVPQIINMSNWVVETERIQVLSKEIRVSDPLPILNFRGLKVSVRESPSPVGIAPTIIRVLEVPESKDPKDMSAHFKDVIDMRTWAMIAMGWMYHDDFYPGISQPYDLQPELDFGDHTLTLTASFPGSDDWIVAGVRLIFPNGQKHILIEDNSLEIDSLGRRPVAIERLLFMPYDNLIEKLKGYRWNELPKTLRILSAMLKVSSKTSSIIHIDLAKTYYRLMTSVSAYRLQLSLASICLQAGHPYLYIDTGDMFLKSLHKLFKAKNFSNSPLELPSHDSEYAPGCVITGSMDTTKFSSKHPGVQEPDTVWKLFLSIPLAAKNVGYEKFARIFTKIQSSIPQSDCIDI